MSEELSNTHTLSPASDGFWWLWHEGEWCPAMIRQNDLNPANPPWVRVMNGSGIQGFRMKNPNAYTWGGRITPPEGVE